MTSREVIQRGALDVFRVIGRHGSLFRPKKTETSAKAVPTLERDDFGNQPHEDELHDLHQNAVNIWQTNQSFDALEWKQLQRLPWVFFYPERSQQQDAWLGADHAKVSDWFRSVEDAGRRVVRAALALLRELLYRWPAEIPTFDLIRTHLKQLLDAPNSRRLRRWRELCSTYELLEPDGPDRFSRRWFEGVVEGDKFLETTGLPPEFSTSKFIECAAKHFIVELSSQLPNLTQNQLEQSLRQLETEDQVDLRFLIWKRDIPDIVLTACNKETPPQALREVLQTFFLKHYGDPRFGTNSSWQFQRDDCRELMCRWLVGATLEAFFNLLDQVAIEHMWKYRRAFWQTYLDEGVINNAWIVLGPDAQEFVRDEFQTDNAYGEFIGGQIESNHAVLMMEIRGLTIADWSHNGACRVWTDELTYAPKLYKKQYTRRELMGSRYIDPPSLRVVHNGAEQGTWQRKLSDWIERETGITIGPEQYMQLG